MTSLTIVLVAASCAGAPWRTSEREGLHTTALAAHASEFYCEHGRWPTDVAELEAFPLPDPSRVQYVPGPDPIPWSLLRDAELRPEPDGTLLLLAELPPGSLVDALRSRPVDLQLRVEEPGCWPPVGS